MRLVLTCVVCPEQYELLTDSGEILAYFRVRYGRFEVRVPDVDGRLVYSTWWPDPYKGGFDDGTERLMLMTKGLYEAFLHHGLADHAWGMACALVATSDFDTALNSWMHERTEFVVVGADH